MKRRLCASSKKFWLKTFSAGSCALVIAGVSTRARPWLAPRRVSKCARARAGGLRIPLPREDGRRCRSGAAKSRRRRSPHSPTAAFPTAGSDAARAVFAEYLGGENGEIFDAVRRGRGWRTRRRSTEFPAPTPPPRSLRSDFAAKRRWRPQNIFANIRTACARRDRFRKILRRAGLRARAHGGEVLRPRRNRALCRGVSLFAREARGAFSAGGGGWGNRNFRRAPGMRPAFFQIRFSFWRRDEHPRFRD